MAIILRSFLMGKKYLTSSFFCRNAILVFNFLFFFLLLLKYFDCFYFVLIPIYDRLFRQLSQLPSWTKFVTASLTVSDFSSCFYFVHGRVNSSPYKTGTIVDSVSNDRLPGNIVDVLPERIRPNIWNVRVSGRSEIFFILRSCRMLVSFSFVVYFVDITDNRLNCGVLLGMTSATYRHATFP